MEGVILVTGAAGFIVSTWYSAC